MGAGGEPMKPRGLCRWIGHKLDPECLEINHIAHCVRCGDNDYDDSLEMSWIERRRFYSAVRRDRLRRKLRDISLWWRCPMCGGRFGRHDASACIPF
jgi:hypothetical protein